MRLSEVIEQYIKEMFNEEEEFIEFGRNELAQFFNCVPSQINSVISTRFNPEQGYYVESKRGGGGNIKIKRINVTKDKYVMHIINSIEHDLTQQETENLIKNLYEYDVVSDNEYKLLRIATSDKVLNLPKEYRDKVRTRVFKNMILNLI